MDAVVRVNPGTGKCTSSGRGGGMFVKFGTVWLVCALPVLYCQTIEDCSSALVDGSPCTRFIVHHCAESELGKSDFGPLLTTGHWKDSHSSATFSASENSTEPTSVYTRTLRDAQCIHMPMAAPPPDKKSEAYLRLTKEEERYDYRQISRLVREQWHLMGGVFEWLYSILRNGGDDRRSFVHSTRHLLEHRLKFYLFRRSRNGAYIELYPEEYAWLMDLPRHLGRREVLVESGVAELGLNYLRQVCKVSLVVPLHTVAGEIYRERRGDRYLFVCLGMDGGIKTLYVTNGFKERTTYKRK